MRFAQLRRKLKSISEKVLADQLRQLEQDGIVKRTLTPTRPPRTDYALTPRGELLIPTMQELCDWGSKQFGIQPTMQKSGKMLVPAIES
jgi:DNA-binding HxlR family transcriptional regulator